MTGGAITNTTRSDWWQSCDQEIVQLLLVVTNNFVYKVLGVTGPFKI